MKLISLMLVCCPALALAQGADIEQRILAMEQELARLKSELAQAKAEQADKEMARRQEAQEELQAKAVPESEPESKDGIQVGGALRFQYSYEDYNDGNKDRGGDVDFDVFRLDLNGQIGGVLMSTQYRWYQYMDVVHHAWVGYQLSPAWQVQAGITRVPFGNLGYNSHNFFFSSNYYVGLEDDHDAGIKFVGQWDQHDLRLAFFATDELGGIDGYVNNRSDRYSYDVVGIRQAGEGIYDAIGQAIAEHNSLAARYSYKWGNTELGASLQHGDLRDSVESVGERQAWALHLNSQFDSWNLQLQYTGYEYSLDNGAERVAVGAYHFFDTIPSEADLFTANLAYQLPVNWGPVKGLTFYNDYSLMTNKSGNFSEDTIMNVLGVAVSAGGLYTYFDLVSAKNQPFVGGSMAGDDDDWKTRFNINFGYYF
jgi:uncharacterized small protein (DUF1192 family)